MGLDCRLKKSCSPFLAQTFAVKLFATWISCNVFGSGSSAIQSLVHSQPFLMPREKESPPSTDYIVRFEAKSRPLSENLGLVDVRTLEEILGTPALDKIPSNCEVANGKLRCFPISDKSSANVLAHDKQSENMANQERPIVTAEKPPPQRPMHLQVEGSSVPAVVAVEGPSAERPMHPQVEGLSAQAIDAVEYPSAQRPQHVKVEVSSSPPIVAVEEPPAQRPMHPQVEESSSLPVVAVEEPLPQQPLHPKVEELLSPPFVAMKVPPLQRPVHLQLEGSSSLPIVSVEKPPIQRPLHPKVEESLSPPIAVVKVPPPQRPMHPRVEGPSAPAIVAVEENSSHRPVHAELEASSSMTIENNEIKETMTDGSSQITKTEVTVTEHNASAVLPEATSSSQTVAESQEVVGPLNRIPNPDMKEQPVDFTVSQFEDTTEPKEDSASKSTSSVLEPILELSVEIEKTVSPMTEYIEPVTPEQKEPSLLPTETSQLPPMVEIVAEVVISPVEEELKEGAVQEPLHQSDAAPGSRARISSFSLVKEWFAAIFGFSKKTSKKEQKIATALKQTENSVSEDRNSGHMAFLSKRVKPVISSKPTTLSRFKAWFGKAFGRPEAEEIEQFALIGPGEFLDQEFAKIQEESESLSLRRGTLNQEMEEEKAVSSLKATFLNIMAPILNTPFPILSVMVGVILISFILSYYVKHRQRVRLQTLIKNHHYSRLKKLQAAAPHKCGPSDSHSNKVYCDKVTYGAV